MKNKLTFVLLIALLTLNSCARKIYVDYQADARNTSKIVLKPSSPTPQTFVAINDKLIVDKKYVKSVTINNVPLGNHQIHYTSNNSWYKEELDAHIPLNVENNKEITKIVVVPPMSNGYYAYLTALIIISWLPVLTLK